MFVYLISSLPFIISSIFNLKNKIIFRVSGRIKYSFLRKAVWFLAKNKIDRILIQTKIAKKLLIEKKIFKKKKILYVEDPIIDLDKINFLKKQKIEKKFLNKNYYLSIGRLTVQKNFSFLIKNIEQIIKNYDFHLLILGDGEEKEKLFETIKQKTTNKIHLLGHKKMSANIYKIKRIIMYIAWESQVLL